LRWPHVDLEGGRIRIVENAVVVRKAIIRHAPKTETSVATLPIDAETVDALRRWRKQQMAEALEWGAAYERSDVVFTGEGGQQIHPEWLSEELKRIGRRLELPPLTFRGLRHSAASTALALGVHPRVVQAMLRHRDVRTTLETYSHVTETLAAEAVTRNAEALRAERPVRESR
jgi:integrase